MLANLGNLYLKCLQKGISMINKDCLSRTIERFRNQSPDVTEDGRDAGEQKTAELIGINPNR